MPATQQSHITARKRKLLDLLDRYVLLVELEPYLEHETEKRRRCRIKDRLQHEFYLEYRRSVNMMLHEARRLHQSDRKLSQHWAHDLDA